MLCDLFHLCQQNEARSWQDVVKESRRYGHQGILIDLDAVEDHILVPVHESPALPGCAMRGPCVACWHRGAVAITLLSHSASVLIMPSSSPMLPV